MSNHEENVKLLEKIAKKIGEENFKKAINDLFKKFDNDKKTSCQHEWKLSFIAGDGYNCTKCGSWKDE